MGQGELMRCNSDVDAAIAWPDDADAVAFRVLLRAEGSEGWLLDQVVEEPRLGLPVSYLAGVGRCYWRVMVQRAGGGEWEEYLPELVWVDGGLAGQPELEWPGVGGAVAYRVVVRDDERDEVVLKDGFLSSPGRVDWSRLDASHRHRAHVQAWVDGQWINIGRHRTLFPPPERVLVHGRQQHESRLLHVIVVRFENGLTDAVYGVRRPQALERIRMRLFERCTFPSLALLSAMGAEWFVWPGADLPDETLLALREMCGDRVVAPQDRERVQSTTAELAVYWLRAGDGLHPHVLRAVEDRATRSRPLHGGAFAIEFPLCVEATPRGPRLAIDPPPACFAVIVKEGAASVEAADPRPPLQRLRSLDSRVEEWSVPALLRLRPGPYEHPSVLRQRGPLFAAGLLGAFGADLAEVWESPAGAEVRR